MIKLPSFIIESIYTLKWHTFCEGTHTIQPTFIQSFYEGKLHKEQDKVKIDRVVIPFNAWEINGMFKLPSDSKAEGNKIIESSMQVKMDDALKLIAKLASKWNTSLKGIRLWPPPP